MSPGFSEPWRSLGTGGGGGGIKRTATHFLASGTACGLPTIMSARHWKRYIRYIRRAGTTRLQGAVREWLNTAQNQIRTSEYLEFGGGAGVCGGMGGLSHGGANVESLWALHLHTPALSVLGHALALSSKAVQEEAGAHERAELQEYLQTDCAVIRSRSQAYPLPPVCLFCLIVEQGWLSMSFPSPLFVHLAPPHPDLIPRSHNNCGALPANSTVATCCVNADGQVSYTEGVWATKLSLGSLFAEMIPQAQVLYIRWLCKLKPAPLPFGMACDQSAFTLLHSTMQDCVTLTNASRHM